MLYVDVSVVSEWVVMLRGDLNGVVVNARWLDELVNANLSVMRDEGVWVFVDVMSVVKMGIKSVLLGCKFGEKFLKDVVDDIYRGSFRS